MKRCIRGCYREGMKYEEMCKSKSKCEPEFE